MIKKMIFSAAIISQLLVSCSPEDKINPTESDLSLSKQIEKILQMPYSQLSPSEQKVKLENEANELLNQLNKTQTSSAITAIENLNRLLDLSSVDVFNGKTDNGISDVFSVSEVYGIYTWNNASSKWTKTNSSTELKFIFPAKKDVTKNNAVLSLNSISSSVKIKIDENSGKINDEVFLPSMVTAFLTIDDTKVALINSNASYSNGSSVPTNSSLKMTLNDGYVWDISALRNGTNNTAKSEFTFNGKNLLSFNFGSTADIDKLLNGEKLIAYQGKANFLAKINSNLTIVGDMNLAGYAEDLEKLEKNNELNNYESSSENNLKTSQERTKISNKNMKLALVSQKDGTKIADIFLRTEKSEERKSCTITWQIDDKNPWGGEWVPSCRTINYYDEVFYLKFNDQTEASMSSYFSTGFDSFVKNFENFINGFNK